MTLGRGPQRPPSAEGSPVPRSPRRVLLVGMMGSGKTTIGELLAKRLGWPFRDNDELVRRATGQTPRQLLAAGGEAQLRAAEAAAFRDGLALEPPVVLAVAAGVVLRAADRRLLRGGGFVAWLDAPPEVLAARAAGSAHRPWLDRDPVTWFRAESSRRSPLYQEVADLRLDVSELNPDAAVSTIVATLPQPH